MLSVYFEIIQEFWEKDEIYYVQGKTVNMEPNFGQKSCNTREIYSMARYFINIRT